MISKQEFFQIMTEAGNAYSVDVNKGQLAAYYDALNQYEPATVRQAFKSHVLTSEWFPKISQIISAIEGTGKEKNANAWVKVMLEIRKTGSYGEPRVSPEIREAIEKIGGWKTLCAMTHKDLEFKAKDFADVYQSPVDGLALGHNTKAQVEKRLEKQGESL